MKPYGVAEISRMLNNIDLVCILLIEATPAPPFPLGRRDFMPLFHKRGNPPKSTEKKTTKNTKSQKETSSLYEYNLNQGMIIYNHKLRYDYVYTYSQGMCMYIICTIKV